MVKNHDILREEMIDLSITSSVEWSNWRFLNNFLPKKKELFEFILHCIYHKGGHYGEYTVIKWNCDAEVLFF